MGVMDWIKKMFSPGESAATPARSVGRNDPCWCGSGQKYKKCHLREDMHKRVEARYAAQFSVQNQGGGMAASGKKGKRGRNLPPEAAQPPQ